jgi:2-amino-4-hydroxy-6-hydroxymethyldihydropteridine diphosphokinase
MDRIFLRELTTEAIIGIYDWERRVRQTINIDLEIPCDVRRAAAADDIDATVNYKKVAKRILEFIARSEFHLVETLAERTALMVLEEFNLDWIRLTLNKPGAVRGSKDVGVMIERNARDLEKARKRTAGAKTPVADKTRVYVAAGSNVEPVRHLALVLDELERRFGALSVSTAYRNRAFGFEGPDFINLVIGFDTAEPVEQVVDELRDVERLCGRTRAAPKWAPRSMDLDILLYGELTCDEPDLTLPRPDLLRRAYMLGPLAEIAPGLSHPVSGRTISALWEAFDRSAHPLEPVTIPRSGPHPPPESGR